MVWNRKAPLVPIPGVMKSSGLITTGRPPRLLSGDSYIQRVPAGALGALRDPVQGVPASVSNLTWIAAASAGESGIDHPKAASPSEFLLPTMNQVPVSVLPEGRVGKTASPP